MLLRVERILLLLAHCVATARPTAPTPAPTPTPTPAPTAPPPLTVRFADLSLGGVLPSARESPPHDLVGARMPSSAQRELDAAKWRLSTLPVGAWLQFESNASDIIVSWSLAYCLGAADPAYAKACRLNQHDVRCQGCYASGADRTATGCSGWDLYAYDPSMRRWRSVMAAKQFWPASTWVQSNGNATFVQTVSGIAPPMATLPVRKFRIYLPTANGLRRGSLSVSHGDILRTDDSWQSRTAALPPIVVIGSAVELGGVTSRAGFLYTSVLSRTLMAGIDPENGPQGREVINLALGSSATMDEDAVFSELTQLNSVGAIIVSTGGMTATEVTNRTQRWVRALRKSSKRAATPIVMAEGAPQRAQWLLASQETRATQNATQRAYDALISAGDANLHYVSSASLFTQSNDTWRDHDVPYLDPTFDSERPTDDGHDRIARFYSALLPSILEGDPRSPLPHPTVLPSTLTSNPPAAYPPSSSAATVNFQVETLTTTWAEITDQSFGVRGRGFTETHTPWSRLRKEVTQADMPRYPAVWGYSFDSAGLYTVFATDADAIHIEYEVGCAKLASNFPEYGINCTCGGPTNVAPGRSVDPTSISCIGGAVIGEGVNYTAEDAFHFSASGLAGIDLYGWDTEAKKWRFVATFRNLTDSDTQHGLLATGLHSGRGKYANTTATKYMILWPSYENVAGARIGVSGGTAAQPCAMEPPQRETRRPVVWYGTSITQGGVASRPGHIFTTMISRILDRDVINLGFNGNGHMTIAVAKELVRIDAAAFVIDCEWNMAAGEIAANAAPLVRYLRANGTRHDAPIILAEGTRDGSAWVTPSAREGQAGKQAAFFAAYVQLVEEGVKNLHYVTMDELFPDSLTNPTVCGVHSADLGTTQLTKFYTQLLSEVL